MTVQNELLFTLMKLRTGTKNLDLAERFNISNSTVSNKIITWINLLYVALGTLNIWPHRDIIIQKSPKEFQEKYKDTVIIIDATELTVQVPSSLQKQSECYSNYKHHTTLKSLIGVDPMGGVMFVRNFSKGSDVAQHRIHVERAIGKVKRFRIFQSLIPVSMFGTINQIWTVACLISNFQNPVISDGGDE
ncbi:uncharacterized protein [Apostichopus japonicus]|uniref:uncharacterized protein n=1 Tax=Stichopus japonicus TaxID=307972 RepID=UPI003AB7E59B